MILKSTYTDLDLKLRVADNRQELFDATKRLIRNGFDRAITSLEAESWIALAKEKGYNEMVEEMVSDLETELTA